MKLPWNHKTEVPSPRQWLLIKLAGDEPVAINLQIEGRILNVDPGSNKGCFYHLATTHQAVDGDLNITVADAL